MRMTITLGVLILVALAGVQSMYGQGNATIVGVVSDSTKAAVPGARVTLINVDTGIRATAVTDSGGRYNFPQLAVGNYRVEVVSEGFKKATESGINLTAEQISSVNLTLELGDVKDSIEVSAAAPALETVSSSVRSVIRRELIEDLPLNGRNALDLATLLPGAVNQSGARVSLSEENGVSVNGARGSDNNVLLDGGANVDVYNGTPTSLPNPDALQEFSVSTSTFSSEYGRTAGSLVSAVTRGGSNQYHGTLYEYLRNDVMDARSFFAVKGLVNKPRLKRNQFGASIGGPIRRDKSFLFFAWESLRQTNSITSSGTVMPTALERSGDFSQSSRKPIDPLTGAAFPSNMIPSARFSQAAVKLTNLIFPLPNVGNTLTYNAPGYDNRYQFVTRFDHQFTANDRIYVSYFHYNTVTGTPGTLPLFNNYNSWINDHVTANYAKIVTPNMVNSLSYTFNLLQVVRFAEPILPDQFPGKPPTLAPGLRFQDVGVQTTPSNPQYTVAPRFGSITGYFSMSGNTYFDVNPYVHEFRDALTITRGAHLIKVGAEFTFNEAYRHESNAADGSSFGWNGSRATNGWAEFLLGLPNTYNQQSLLRTDSLYNSFAAFVQDDWKIRSNLTLNLGLRYEPAMGIHDGNNEIIAFRPGQQSTLYPRAPLGLVVPGDPGVPPSTYAPDWNNLAPRVGFAYLPFGPNSNTSIRGAYGIFYNTERAYLMNETQLNQPFVLNITLNNPSFENPWLNYPGGNPYPFKPPTTPEARQAFPFVLQGIGRFFNPDWVTPYNQQWNFTIQQQIPWDTVVTAGYVGSKGTHLVLNREINPGIFLPGNGADGKPLSTSGNVDARRPNRLYQGIDEASTTGNSNYHSLQLSANKRFSKGITFLMNYTWSKALDYQSLDRNANLPQDSSNVRGDYGPADFDHRHNFVTSVLAEIPSPWRHGPAGAFTHGWRLNGIYRYISGDALTVVPGTDTVLRGASTQRVDIRGNPLLPSGRSLNEQLSGFWNVSAFAAGAPGAFGNEGRNALYGPGQYNVDMSLFKITNITERARVEFRWELFNALNHPNPGDPNVTLSSSTFGKITSTTAPRIMQVGMKILF
jgi:hypothetical protein